MSLHTSVTTLVTHSVTTLSVTTRGLSTSALLAKLGLGIDFMDGPIEMAAQVRRMNAAFVVVHWASRRFCEPPTRAFHRLLYSNLIDHSPSNHSIPKGIGA